MAETLKLDEGWEFAFDAVDEGLIEEWFAKKPAKARAVSIPHDWTEAPNGEKAHIGYYFNSFKIDKRTGPTRWFLRFQSLQHYATVWLNGEEVATHYGGYVPFEVEVTRPIRHDGTNLLVVRAQNLDRQGKIFDLSVPELALGAPFFLSPSGGLLGQVELFSTGRAGIRAVNCFPDYEADRVAIVTRFWNPRNYQASIEFELTNPKGESGTVTKEAKIDKENGMLSLSLQLEDVKVWSLDDPALYRLRVALANSPPVETRFGMRGADVDKGAFKLNHETVKVKGISYPWLFAFHPGRPPEDLDLEKELGALKEAGFNLIRSSGAPLPISVLEICDRIGMLVVQETTCFSQRSSKQGLEGLKEQIHAIIERYASHPSIFAWAIGAENGSMVLENGNKLLRFAAEHDSSRPVFSNLCSVYLDGAGGGKIDVGKVYEPALQQIGPSEWHKLNITFPLSLKSFGLLASYCSSKDGKAVADGVHGNKSFWERYNYLKDGLQGKVLVDGLGTSMPENVEELLESAARYPRSPEHRLGTRLRDELEKGFKERGITIWKNVEAFWKDAAALARQALVAQVEAFCINSNVAGYLLDKYADYGVNFSGIVDWQRRPKGIFEALKRLNRPVYVIAEAEERTPYIGTSAAIKIHMVNDGHLGDYGLLLRVKGPNGRIWHQESLPGRAKAGINVVGRFKFPVGFEKGRFTFDLNLSKNNKEIMRTEEIFFVPPEVKLEKFLKHVEVAGSLPDTITSFTAASGPVILAPQIPELADNELAALLAKARTGKVVVLGPLNDEDTQRLAGQGLENKGLTAFRSNGGTYGCYHFALQGPVFKDLPHQCLLDQNYADIMPAWSLEHGGALKMAAGSVCLNAPVQRGLALEFDGSPLRWGADIAHLVHGKGKVVFCQYDIFSRLGRNALADALFANLLTAYARLK